MPTTQQPPYNPPHPPWQAAFAPYLRCMSHSYSPELDLTALINKMRAEGAFNQPQTNSHGFHAHGYGESFIHPHKVAVSRPVLVEFEAPSGDRYNVLGTMHEVHEVGL